MIDHYCIGLDEPKDGWYIGQCKCGWNGGEYPTADDACDALMDHAYEEGCAYAVARGAWLSAATTSVLRGEKP